MGSEPVTWALKRVRSAQIAVSGATELICGGTPITTLKVCVASPYRLLTVKRPR